MMLANLKKRHVCGRICDSLMRNSHDFFPLGKFTPTKAFLWLLWNCRQSRQRGTNVQQPNVNGSVLHKRV